jgi:hypothetical protein
VASKTSQAWPIFDHIVATAAPAGAHSNPWSVGPNGHLIFVPDYDTLERLLGVPLHLKATTQSGVPALALDVWLSYELRRAGFGADQVWPRAISPRVLPAALKALIEDLPKKTLQKSIQARVSKKNIKGATASAASILGKNYLKQVDVIISDWWTGPELLVSTKRMDSSYGKNAPNRVEESYGDAKNLRLRHPLAALGFMFGLNCNIFELEPKTAVWLFDLLIKLGREDDAYDATCLVLIEYSSHIVVPEEEDEEDEPSAGLVDPGPEIAEEEEVETPPESEIAQIVQNLPKVTIRRDLTPPELLPDRLLAALVARVLEITPVTMHEEARRRRP